jgi:hypothetical protein
VVSVSGAVHVKLLLVRYVQLQPGRRGGVAESAQQCRVAQHHSAPPRTTAILGPHQRDSNLGAPCFQIAVSTCGDVAELVNLAAASRRKMPLRIEEAKGRPERIREPRAFRALHVGGLAIFEHDGDQLLLHRSDAEQERIVHLPWTHCSVRLAA